MLERRPVVVATWLKVVWMRPVSRIDQPRQRVEVGVLELRQLAPALDLGDDLVLVADLGQHAGVGREAGLAAALPAQLELLEQHHAELLGRADRELVPGELEDLALQLGDPLGHALADLGQPLGVELDAGALHGGQDLDQRHLDLAQEAVEPELVEPLPLASRQLVGQASVDRGIARGLPLLGGERELPGLGARGGGRQARIGGELVEVVRAPGRVDQVGGDDRVVLELEAARWGDREQAGAPAPAERLRVMRDQRPAAELLGERDEVGRVARHHPLAVARRPAAGGDGDRDLLGGEIAGATLLRLDLDRLLDPALGHDLAELLVEPLHHGAQLELGRELAQAAAVRRRANDLGDVDRHLDVVLQGRELLRDAGVIGVLGEVLLPLRPGDLVDARQHRLEGAELLQQLGRGLVADPGDAGDVVGGVALEADQVGDQLRRHAVALDHPLAIVDLRLGDAPRGGHHPNPVRDHLVDVPIAGHDHHRDLRFAGLADQGGDHVVRLPALDLDVVEAERLGERPQVRPLLRQQVGPRWPLRLVVRVLELATRHPRVPGHDHRARVVVDQDLGHHRGEAVDRVRRAPVGGRDRLREREERPVGEAVAVDQEQLAVALRTPSWTPSASPSWRAHIHPRTARGPDGSTARRMALSSRI